MSEIKINLRAYYNQEAKTRNAATKQDWKLEEREQFHTLANSENKTTLLELGAGPGYDSQYFMNNGMQVVAIDLSGEMVKLCKEKSIEAYEMDFCDILQLDKKFDCVWAFNTLLHVPKTDLPQVLKNIDTILNPNGLFFMGVYGGLNSEGEYAHDLAAFPNASSIPRFFSRYSNEALQAVLCEYFTMLNFNQYDVGRGEFVFQSVLMRKNNF